MATFVTPADLTARKDARMVARLASDSGTPISSGAIATDPVIATILDAAEGDVLAALRYGGRYSDDDLAALTGSALAFLKTIIVEVATVMLLRRRPDVSPASIEAQEKIRDMYLKDLKTGKAVLGGGDDESLAASRTSVDGTSESSLDKRNAVVERMPRYFPQFSLPDGRRR